MAIEKEFSVSQSSINSIKISFSGKLSCLSDRQLFGEIILVDLNSVLKETEPLSVMPKLQYWQEKKLLWAHLIFFFLPLKYLSRSQYKYWVQKRGRGGGRLVERILNLALKIWNPASCSINQSCDFGHFPLYKIRVLRCSITLQQLASVNFHLLLLNS